MDQAMALMGIGIALLLGAMSPGPSFVVASRAALASRRLGIASAFAMALGGAAIATCAVLGLQSALLATPRAFLILKGAGAAYLLFLAIRLWRGAGSSIRTGDATRADTGTARVFAKALLTQLSNPKTLLVYGSIFAAGLPSMFEDWFLPLLVAVVFAVELGWYLVVAFVFGSATLRSLYLRASAWIDRAAALAMGGLAARIVLDRT